jgi:hypothetical protein
MTIKSSFSEKLNQEVIQDCGIIDSEYRTTTLAYVFGLIQQQGPQALQSNTISVKSSELQKEIQDFDL